MRFIVLCFMSLLCLLPAMAQEAVPAPSGEIAFVSKRDGDIHHVFVVNVDGSNLRQLTSGPLDSFTGVWSPDGTKMAFMQEAVQDVGVSALWVMDADGSHAIEIVRERPGEMLALVDEFLSWSPDSTRFLYRRYYDFQKMELIIVNADGTNPQTLVPDVGILRNAYFLTNESLVITDGDYSTERPHILRYDLADGTLTPLMDFGIPIKPSPDGTQLAFIRQLADASLVVRDLMTGEERVIQQTLAGLEPGARPFISSLQWSADGSVIAGMMQDSATGRSYLFVARVDGTTYTVFEAADRRFSLSPDGAYAVYSTSIPYSPIEQDIGYQITISRTDGQGTPILFPAEEIHSQPEWRPIP